MRICYQMTRVLLLNILRDRRALIAMFLMPLVTTLILSFALGPIFKGNGIPKFTVAVSNLDQGPMGAKLVGVLKSMSTQVEVKNYSTPTKAKSAVTQGTASVALEIPAKYSIGLSLALQNASARNVQAASIEAAGTQATSTQPAGTNTTSTQLASTHAEDTHAANVSPAQPPATQIVIEAGQNSNTEGQVVSAVVDQFDKIASEEGYAAETMQQTGQRVTVPTVILQSQATSLHQMTAGSYYAMGMLVLFLLNFSFSRAYQILHERQGDHFKRLASAPVSKTVLGVGYFVSNFIALLFQGAFTLLCDRWILGIYLGPVLQVSLIVAGYTLALAGLTVMVGAWTNNIAVLNGITNLGGNLAAVIGGSFYPLYFFPHWMQLIGRVLPNGQALNAFLDSITGIAMAGLTVPILYMIGFGLVTFLLARTRQWSPAN